MTTTVTDQPRSGIAALWFNKEARAVFYQILTITLAFAFFAWIGTNAATNLAKIGKGYDFDFLSQPASYDIGMSLIEYTSRSSHLRAMFVGILNTLMVAGMGIILATILGFIFGVLRLSHNWIANRTVYSFIEFIRNVPVLLHILLVHGIVVHSFPRVREAVSFGDTVFLTNRGITMPSPIPEAGFEFVGIAFLIGIVIAIGFARYARKVQEDTGRTLPVLWVSLGAIIGLPLLVFAVLGAPLAWEYPKFSRFNFKGGMTLRPEFTALWLALSIYTSAFIAEIVRGGIMAVHHGQTEAAHALGLRHGRTLRLVIIPQALRIIVPPLTSQYLNLTKNSSLAIAVGYMDIVGTIGGISLNQTGREMECMTIVLLLYLCFSLLISAFMNWYNKRIKLVER